MTSKHIVVVGREEVAFKCGDRIASTDSFEAETYRALQDSAEIDLALQLEKTDLTQNWPSYCYFELQQPQRV
jgi:hypothetical protein